MTPWDELVATALVGTERRPLAPTTVAVTAACLGADLPAARPEVVLLEAAGVLATWRRAGTRPTRQQGGPPAAAPPDPRPAAPPTATQLLELLLDRQVVVTAGPGPLVAEWLQRCAASGHRAPDRVLVRLLTAATADPDLRVGVVQAGGPRVRWLAERNPVWAWAQAPSGAGADDVGGPDAAALVRAWATGDRDSRLRLLGDLRRTQPHVARRLVASTWAGEPAKERAAIVAAMTAGLDAGDEPFLEAALDDRASTVREGAAAHLARLPTSRLAMRMAARLRPLVDVGGLRAGRLDVGYPEEPDRAARRDGIVDGGAPPRTGPRAWWLTQVVAATPLSLWEELVGHPPADVVRRIERPELRHGLVVAARRQHDARWAEALLAQRPDPRLLSALPALRAGKLLGELVASTPDPQLLDLLGAVAGPWPARTSGAVLVRLRSLKPGVAVVQALGVVAGALDPAVLPEVERWVAELPEDDTTRRAVRGLAHLLSIRRTIAQELP